MQLFDLRKAPHHIPQIAEWHQDEWGHMHPGRTAQQLAAEMQEYLSEPDIPIMFVCEEDGHVMGTSSLIACDMDTHPELGPWLANVYVDASQRGKGLGKLLVKEVMQVARSKGLPAIYLFTTNQSAFYQSLGWHTLFQENYKGDDVTVMVYNAFSGSTDQSNGEFSMTSANALPADVVLYKTTPVFDEHTIPAGLLKNHNTKEGVWGRIVVVEGALLYTLCDTGDTVVLDKDQPGIALPKQLHQVAPQGTVKFFVEFYRKPGSE